jgi:hypothetical protein
MRYLLAPGDIPTGGAKGFAAGLAAWFTPEHIGGVLALLVVAVFVAKLWKVLMGHPVLFVVVLILAGVALGFVTLTPPRDPGHQPLVPATGPPIPR